MSHAADMAAFDRLPRAVRERLRASLFDLPPRAIADDCRRYGLTGAAALAFIGEMETWARGEAAHAQHTGSNRLSPRTIPDVEAMALRAKRGGFA